MKKISNLLYLIFSIIEKFSLNNFMANYLQQFNKNSETHEGLMLIFLHYLKRTARHTNSKIHRNGRGTVSVGATTSLNCE